MSDQTITHFCASVKDPNARLKKLTQAVDRLDMLVHHQKRLAKCYKELSIRCLQLAENLDHMDVVAIEIRQELNKLHSDTRRPS